MCILWKHCFGRADFPLLRKAAARGMVQFEREFTDFCAENARWLADYALFDAAKKEFKFSDSTFPIVDSEDPYQISFSGSATVSMKLKDLPDYLKKHCDTSKAK